MPDSASVSDMESEKQRQIQLNLSLPPIKPRANVKHVSRACLNCRKRHFKCNGQLPTCDKCTKSGTVCTYVESKRGGSRKRGVSKATKKPKIEDDNIIEIEDLPHRRKEKVSVDPDNDAFYKFPCQGSCDKPGCPGRLSSDQKSTTDGESELQIVNEIRKKARTDTAHLPSLPHCMCATNASKAEVPSALAKLDIGIAVSNPQNLVELDLGDKDSIIRKYYETFHRCHPLLPPRHEIDLYLEDSSAQSELLHIMNVIGEGQETSIYSRNIELLSDRLLQCLDVVKTNNVNDIVTLHCLFLISIVAHVSGLHVFSKQLRQFCIQMIQQWGINQLDAEKESNDSTPKSPSPEATEHANLFSSKRLSSVSKDSIADSARRVFWELTFFDVIIGSADGRTLTNFTLMDVKVNYPVYPPAYIFDYKGRAEAASLVNDAIKLNLAIISKKPLDRHLPSLKAALSSMEMKLNDPPSYNAPLLINRHGVVNEGVHQSILLHNYARIFVHRPFSFLWKINSPQLPRCADDNISSSNQTPVGLKGDAIATVETSKTIAAADSIIKVLMDTGATEVLRRTPLFACSLALASLVHLSAYIWIENALTSPDSTLEGSSFGSEDLSVLAEYIKLSLSAIYPISRHWILSGRLTRHIRDSLSKLRPNLYSRLRDQLPNLEDQIKNFDMNSTRKAGEQTSLNTSNHTTSESGTDSTGNTSVFNNSHLNVGFINDNLDTGRGQKRPRPEYMADFNTYQDVQKQSLSNLNNLINSDSVPSDINYNFDEIDHVSPVSDTGCDWIDKALMDYFEDDNALF